MAPMSNSEARKRHSSHPDPTVAELIDQAYEKGRQDAHARVHEVMRGWAKVARYTSFSLQQRVAAQNLSHVLEELRRVVGNEGL